MGQSRFKVFKYGHPGLRSSGQNAAVFGRTTRSDLFLDSGVVEIGTSVCKYITRVVPAAVRERSRFAGTRGTSSFCPFFFSPLSCGPNYNYDPTTATNNNNNNSIVVITAVVPNASAPVQPRSTRRSADRVAATHPNTSEFFLLRSCPGVTVVSLNRPGRNNTLIRPIRTVRIDYPPFSRLHLRSSHGQTAASHR